MNKKDKLRLEKQKRRLVRTSPASSLCGVCLRCKKRKCGISRISGVCRECSTKELRRSQQTKPQKNNLLDKTISFIKKLLTK